MRKTKRITEKRRRELMEECRVYNKRMKQSNNRWMCFDSVDDYIDWKFGARKVSSVRPQPNAGDITVNKRFERETDAKYAPSVMTRRQSKEATAKQDVPQYTGTYIKGIAQMHKSNAVPLGQGGDPEEYATMRRGH